MRSLVALAGAALLIAGCGQSDGATDLPPSPTVSDPSTADPSTELESCMVGTWDLDVGFLEPVLIESTRASMERAQLGGTIESTYFSGIQTTTFATDGTFVTQVSLSIDMTMEPTDLEGVEIPARYKGYKIPTSHDSAGTATGTWTADTDSFFATVESTEIEGATTVDGEPVDGPGGVPVLLPDEPTPTTCSASVLTILTSAQDADPIFPDELTFTRHE